MRMVPPERSDAGSTVVSRRVLCGQTQGPLWSDSGSSVTWWGLSGQSTFGKFFLLGKPTCSFCVFYTLVLGFPVGPVVNNLPMQEMQVWSLGQEDPLEEQMATHSSILARETPWTEKPGRLQSMGLQRVGHNWATEFKVKFSTLILCLILHVEKTPLSQDRERSCPLLSRLLFFKSNISSHFNNSRWALSKFIFVLLWTQLSSVSDLFLEGPWEKAILWKSLDLWSSHSVSDVSALIDWFLSIILK